MAKDNPLTNYQQQSLKTILEHDQKKDLEKLLVEGLSPDTMIETSDVKESLLDIAINLHKNWAVKLLITHGVDIEKRGEFGMTPLIKSISKGTLLTFKLILNAGADPNRDDALGLTPLYYAVQIEKKQKSLLLIQRGAEPRLNIYKDESVWTLTKKDHMFLALEKAGVDPHLADKNLRNALHFAAYRGCGATVRRMVKTHKLNINLPDKSGYTPLMMAAMGASPKCARRLVAMGADITMRDNNGQEAIGLIDHDRCKFSGTLDEMNDILFGAKIKLLSRELSSKKRAAPAVSGKMKL